MNDYLPKDFLETTEGLCFAVVAAGTEKAGGQDKVLSFLRYVKSTALNSLSPGEGEASSANQAVSIWQKVGTEAANSYLQSRFPAYLHHSSVLDADLHAVPIECIKIHYHPRQRLQQLLQQPTDKVEEDVIRLCDKFAQNGLDLAQVGITGSVLIGAQNPASDIDLVIYGREVFHQARSITEKLIDDGLLENLDDNAWYEAYARRSCELSLSEYVWHERRKFNKGMVNGRKFDLNYVASDEHIKQTKAYIKLSKLSLQARITQDSHSFDYPALYRIDHPQISTVVCFIATYTGQARVGEAVAISGLMEQDDDGGKRVVVGSSREAPGEYIKVVHNPIG